MEKSLPPQAMEILHDALELEVLTFELDTAVAAAIGCEKIDPQRYATAYRTVGRRADRERQIDLIVDLARRLGRMVHHAWIGRLLRLARRPAEAAGFAMLQSFLERGFDAFRQLGDATDFIAAIEARERGLMERLFSAAPEPFAGLQQPSECGGRGD